MEESLPSQAPVAIARRALVELEAMLRGGKATCSALDVGARRALAATQALHARECEAQRRAELALLELQAAKRRSAELRWEVRGARAELAALGVETTGGASKRVAEGLRQVREQDLHLQRATARLEATSLAIFAGRASLEDRGSMAPWTEAPCRVQGPAGGVLTASRDDNDTGTPALAPGEAVSTAHGFYLQLKECMMRAGSLGASKAPGAVSLQALGQRAESPGVAECQTEDLLAALKLSVSDVVADNLALSRPSKSCGECCSFTTRHQGICARIRVEDTVSASSPGASEILVSCDLDVGGACKCAVALNAQGLSADQVVQRAFWPELAKRGILQAES